MKKTLLILCLVVPSCASSPPRSAEVWKEDWIKVGPGGSTAVRQPPTNERLKAFAEQDNVVTGIAVSVSADDFRGSKLYDGFDLTVRPVGTGDRVVKKLGHLSVILHSFDIHTRSAKGEELMRWHVPASQMAGLWRRVGLDHGYHMKLVWRKRPKPDYVRLEVRFETLDGRTFVKLRTDSVDQPRYRWLKE